MFYFPCVSLYGSPVLFHFRLIPICFLHFRVLFGHILEILHVSPNAQPICSIFRLFRKFSANFCSISYNLFHFEQISRVPFHFHVNIFRFPCFGQFSTNIMLINFRIPQIHSMVGLFYSIYPFLFHFPHFCSILSTLTCKRSRMQPSCSIFR